MKDHPYFKVGERVMIFSESYPELNGEDEIYEVVHEFAETVDRVTGKTVSCAFTKSKFAYKLKHTRLSHVNDDGSEYEGVWAQSALRKIHEPSTESFEELMKSLTVCE